MKTTHSVILNEWITKNKSILSSAARGTIQDCADRAAGELQFKVSTSALRELMQSQGMETKRVSMKQADGEIEKQAAEIMELRRTLAKVASAKSWEIPEEFKEFVFGGLKDEIKAGILDTD